VVSGLKDRDPEIEIDGVVRWYRSRRPRMDVKFPILGLLMEENMTGYDLKRRFNDVVGFYYRTSDGSLYPALNKMERDRLVTMKIHRTGARARKVYAITSRGREHFLAMLAEPPTPAFVHNEGLVKLFFGRYQPRVVLGLLQRSQHREAALAAVLAGARKEFIRQEKDPFRRAVFEFGRRIQAFNAQLTKEIATDIGRALGAAVALKEKIAKPLR
jgi:DNA-binding PadR family transcriptional regulator